MQIQYKSKTIDLGDFNVRQHFIIHWLWRMTEGRDSMKQEIFSVLRNVADKSPVDAFHTTVAVLRLAPSYRVSAAAIYNGMDLMRQLSGILTVAEVMTDVGIEIRGWTSIFIIYNI